MQSMDLPRAGRTTRRRALTASVAALSSLAWPQWARAAYVLRPWPAGKPTPALALTDLDGNAWSLDSCKGRPVILNFWASWCEPCRAEMPSLERLATRHEKAGLVVLSVNYQEAAPTIKKFLMALPFKLPILLDRDGEAAGAWTPRVFPTTVLIDRDGMPRQSVIGDLDWMGDAARRLVDPLLVPRKTA